MSKVPQNQAEKVYSNYEGETFKTEVIDLIGVQKLIREHLYTKPIQTPVQEYLSNALDAMVLSKKTDQPIKVYLPDLSDGMLRIRDFGPGLSDTEVKNIYVNIGVSTKRTDDTSIGCWGYGSKSYYAYTSEFFVISYYNGIETTFLAKINEDDSSSFEIKNKRPTQEANGLEVQCPVRDEDVNKFCEAVVRCCFFWNVKPILIGDAWQQKAESLLAESNNPLFSVSTGRIFKLSEEMKRILGVRKGVIVNAGGIPFNVIDPVFSQEKVVGISKNTETITVVLDYKIGELQIPPNRENLKESKVNTQALTNSYANALVELEEYYYNRIESSANHDLQDLQNACFDYHKNIDSCLRNLKAIKINFNGEEYRINREFKVMWDCSKLGLMHRIAESQSNESGRRFRKHAKEYRMSKIEELPYNSKIPAVVYLSALATERKNTTTINRVINNTSMYNGLFPVSFEFKEKDILYTYSSGILNIPQKFDYIQIDNIINSTTYKWPRSVTKTKILSKICKLKNDQFWFDESTCDLTELEGKVVECFVGNYRSHCKKKTWYEKQAVMQTKKLYRSIYASELDIFYVSSGVYKKMQKLKIKTKDLQDEMKKFIIKEDVDFYTKPRIKVKIPNILKKLISVSYLDELSIPEIEQIKVLCEKEKILLDLKNEEDQRTIPKDIFHFFGIMKPAEIEESETGEFLQKTLEKKYPMLMLLLDNFAHESICNNVEAKKQLINCWKLAMKGKL